MRHRSINRNSAVASGSSFFNGWRSTPGTTPLTSQLILLISTTTTKVEIGSNAARLRLRSLTCSTGQPPSVRMDDEGATTSAAPPHSFSHLGCVTAKRFSLRLAVCAPAPVTHLPGSASGACFAGSHSPWPLPFAPPAPRRSRPLCSSASQLIWQSLTSRDRASSATAPHLPDADRRQLPNGRSRDLPVPAQGASAHARFFDHAGSFGPCDGASETCCLPHSKRRRHPGIGFRGSMAGLCPPLPTLRRRPRGRQRTARGRCRSLLLHRSGLAPPTPCRSPGALRVSHAQPRSLVSVGYVQLCARGAVSAADHPPLLSHTKSFFGAATTRATAVGDGATSTAAHTKNKTDREAYNGCCPCGHRHSAVCLCVYIDETMRGDSVVRVKRHNGPVGGHSVVSC